MNIDCESNPRRHFYIWLWKGRGPIRNIFWCVQITLAHELMKWMSVTGRPGSLVTHRIVLWWNVDHAYNKNETYQSFSSEIKVIHITTIQVDHNICAIEDLMCRIHVLLEALHVGIWRSAVDFNWLYFSFIFKRYGITIENCYNLKNKSL